MGLDVGTKRIGVALADDSVKLAYPYDTIEVDGQELSTIAKLVSIESIETVVVGLPRNQQGEETEQSQVSRQFARALESNGLKVVMQDESLTSVQAENYLKSSKKPYTKADIDKQAASIILQDYMELTYGK